MTRNLADGLLPGDSDAAPDALAEHHEMTILVRDWLSRLSDKQRIVVIRRFGLDNDDPATLEALADEMGIQRACSSDSARGID
jgi:RNA polymerase nonessential primary-like sigma factor